MERERERERSQIPQSIADFFNSEIETIPEDLSQDEKQTHILEIFKEYKDIIHEEKTIGYEKTFQILSEIQTLQDKINNLEQQKTEGGDTIEEQIQEIKKQQTEWKEKLSFLQQIYTMSKEAQKDLIQKGKKRIEDLKKAQKDKTIRNIQDLIRQRQEKNDLELRDEAKKTLEENGEFKNMIKSFRSMFREIKEKTEIEGIAMNLNTGDTQEMNERNLNINELGFYFFLHDQDGKEISLTANSPLQVGNNFMINYLTEEEYNNNFNEEGKEILSKNLETVLKSLQTKKTTYDQQEIQQKNQKNKYQEQIQKLRTEFFNKDKTSLFLEEILQKNDIAEKIRKQLTKVFKEKGKITPKDVETLRMNYPNKLIEILQDNNIFSEK